MAAVVPDVPEKSLWRTLLACSLAASLLFHPVSKEKKV